MGRNLICFSFDSFMANFRRMVMGLLGFYARPSFSFSDDFHPALFGGITLKHGYGRWSGRGKLYTGMVFFF